MRNLQQIRIYSILLVFAFFAIIYSCDLPPIPDQNTSTTDTTRQRNLPDTKELVEGLQAISEDVAELARPNKVQAWVDKLIVKAQPGKEMPQVAQMSEGEIAQYLYQRTVSKTSFELRGQDFREAWILIKTKDGVMGWVHEGGVRYINPAFEQIVEDLLGPPPGSNQRSMGPSLPPPASQRQIIPGKQVGPITVNTSETDLISIYGATRVMRGQVLLPEGKPEPCTVIFPNTREEIRITWKKEDRQQVKAIYFDQADANWYSPQGLSSGLGFKELIKVNQGPFVFFGFDWDYGGVVDDWKSGKLAPLSKYFYVVLSPSPQAPASVLKPYRGNNRFTTNAPQLEKLGIQVSRLVVYLD